MKDKKVLYVSSEVLPYSPDSEIARMSFEAPRMVNNKGGQLRVFMPRFGNINERRHQLHEVIRLSGMNIIINDIDVPLIIKVASIPKERIQVYFIDNDEYFKRSGTLFDENGTFYADNDERCIFFAKGIVETIKKLNWRPDIIHIHGWLPALLPLYLRTFYKDEPLFSESKIITSVFDKGFDRQLNTTLINKVAFDGISKKVAEPLKEPHYYNLMKMAIKNSDGVIVVSEDMPEDFQTYLRGLRKPVLFNSDKETFQDSYHNFYLQILKR